MPPLLTLPYLPFPFLKIATGNNDASVWNYIQKQHKLVSLHPVFKSHRWQQRVTQFSTEGQKTHTLRNSIPAKRINDVNGSGGPDW